MGKGKGPHEYWVYHVKKAQVFMELTISDTFLLKRTLRALQMKLPLKVKFIIINYDLCFFCCSCFR
jgi:ribosomal protein L16/L10AE